MRRAIELLERLRRHPLREEINTAQERFTEFPYSSQVEGRMEYRVIDLLYRTENGWYIVDFKTDLIRDAVHREELLQEYLPQVERYKEALKLLLGI